MNRTKTRLDDSGLSVSTSRSDKLTRAQRFALWLAAIFTTGFVVAVVMTGTWALVALGFVVFLVWVAVLVIHGRKADEEHYLNTWKH